VVEYVARLKADTQVFALHLDLSGTESVEAAGGNASPGGAAPVWPGGGHSLQSEEERSKIDARAWSVLPFLPSRQCAFAEGFGY
jgi:hypothetical protein